VRGGGPHPLLGGIPMISLVKLRQDKQRGAEGSPPPPSPIPPHTLLPGSRGWWLSLSHSKEARVGEQPSASPSATQLPFFPHVLGRAKGPEYLRNPCFSQEVSIFILRFFHTYGHTRYTGKHDENKTRKVQLIAPHTQAFSCSG